MFLFLTLQTDPFELPSLALKPSIGFSIFFCTGVRIDSPMVGHYIIPASYVKPRDRDEIKLPIITYTLPFLDGLCVRRETGGWYTYRKVKEIRDQLWNMTKVSMNSYIILTKYKF